MIKQSKFIIAGAVAMIPDCAGEEVFELYEHTFTKPFTAATDTLEIGVIPATAQLTDMIVIGAGLDTTTAAIGVMDGAVGDKESVRAVGTEFGAAIDVADKETRIPLSTCLAAGQDNTKHRSIGVKLSADVAAGTDKITVAVRYRYV
ncbi:hypothetical protein DL1_08490 [Thioclava dalianensis]|uniref:Uncharacterized protein n=1 Tax=Thioclava dalianensis TaxID=1185766 RepID=A0A074TF74_9RHOB|nr:hypothetical protein [Thioclava dalianensis]KEP68785.1 hypothetical protein DL1_08490 [Thioclava dalianensis]SFN50150.1 hypothetical protein SAMN05216224_10689 [Thioclava dalianensis]